MYVGAKLVIVSESYGISSLRVSGLVGGPQVGPEPVFLISSLVMLMLLVKELHFENPLM